MNRLSFPPEIPPPEFPRPQPQPDLDPPRSPMWPPLITDDTVTDARTALLRQRRVMLAGPLDDAAATRVTAELMMLDGESSREVELIINSEGGPLADVLTVLDVLELMRAPVATRCIGRALGTAAAVLASGTGGRAAAGNAMIGLRLQERYDVSGRAIDVERFAGRLAVARQRLAAHMQAVTGLSDDEVARELDDGEPMTAQTALQRGVIDELITRS
jgi:ATP-dependent Clp protease protease subunit